MVERTSALASDYVIGTEGVIGANNQAGVIFQEIADLQLYQVAAWPDTIADVAVIVTDQLELEVAPTVVGKVIMGKQSAVLRVEPLKWWVFAAVPPSLSSDQGGILDISHSKTHIRITGPNSVNLLNTQLPLDLRLVAFPQNSVASSAMHHVGVTLWHSVYGYELFLPRGFALSLWQVMVASARQFGLQVLAKQATNSK